MAVYGLQCAGEEKPYEGKCQGCGFYVTEELDHRPNSNECDKKQGSFACLFSDPVCDRHDPHQEESAGQAAYDDNRMVAWLRHGKCVQQGADCIE